ncbi:MAG TPA: GYD domain-containing protein [Actinomycetota bacterium]|nr:GYD domain-containing protein [Actinomycetota bacterium]
MAKYLIKGTYTQRGVQGLSKEGGSGRRDAVEKLISGVGGKVEALYFAFGGTDIYVTVDLPDNATAAAIALRVNSAGAIQVETVPLLTPEEVDQATQKDVDYRPPGA